MIPDWNRLSDEEFLTLAGYYIYTSKRRVADAQEAEIIRSAIKRLETLLDEVAELKE